MGIGSFGCDPLGSKRYPLGHLAGSYLAFLNFIKDRIFLNLCFSSLLLSCFNFAWREGSMLGLSLSSLKLVTLCVHYHNLVLWDLDYDWIRSYHSIRK